jgi:hypothetical protein
MTMTDRRTTRHSGHRFGTRWITAVALVTTALAAVPAHSAPIAVEVEAVRPEKPKHPTHRFLKANSDWLRARYDLLREKPLHRRGLAADIDPRYLAYRDMLAAILQAEDSVRTADNANERRQLLRSITELGRLETELDQMERLLAGQRDRLGVLQRDFTGDQRTALVVVLSGYPTGSEVTGVTVVLEEGSRLTAPLTADQRASLGRGGIVQVFHGFVEPREQVVEVIVAGDRWPAGSTGFVTLDPARDRLTFLRLDLAGVEPAAGAASMRASTWLHDTTLADGDD